MHLLFGLYMYYFRSKCCCVSSFRKGCSDSVLKTAIVETPCESVASNTPVPLPVNRKRKSVKMSTSKHGGSKTRSENAQWPLENEVIYIKLCYDMFKEGKLFSSTFRSVVWNDICVKLNKEARSKLPYKVKQCQDKWGRLKTNWKLYHNALTKDTGLGIDHSSGELTGSPGRLAESLGSCVQGSLENEDSPENPRSPESPKSPNEDSIPEDATLLAYIAQAAIPIIFPDRVPRNTSLLQGADWIAKIITGHDGRFYDNFRMDKPTFFHLLIL